MLNIAVDNIWKNDPSSARQTGGFFQGFGKDLFGLVYLFLGSYTNIVLGCFMDVVWYDVRIPQGRVPPEGSSAPGDTLASDS